MGWQGYKGGGGNEEECGEGVNKCWDDPYLEESNKIILAFFSHIIFGYIERLHDL